MRDMGRQYNAREKRIRAKRKGKRRKEKLHAQKAAGPLSSAAV